MLKLGTTKIIDYQNLHIGITRIAKKHGVAKVWLFGSYARHTATENSDIDILIEKGKLNSYADIFRFQYEIEDYFAKKVDIVTTESIKSKFFLLRNIKKDSIQIYG